MIAAASGGHLEIVRFLVEAGADLEYSRDEDGTVLIWAMCHGHFDMVRYLVDAGADVNKAKEPDKYTPFLIAAQKGRLDIAR